MISVVIPNYNGEKVIKRAIDSVIAQEIPDTEIVVVDDCSSDASVDLIKSYGARVRVVKQVKNEGPNVARNVGLRTVSHTTVLFLDNDDYLLPGALAAWYDDLRDNNVDAVVGPMLYDRKGNLTFRDSTPPVGLRSGLETSYAWLEDWVAPCSVLWKRETVEAIGGWSPAAGRSRDNDGELVWRAAIHGATFYWSGRGGGVYVQHDAPSRVSRQRDPHTYENHLLWLADLVNLAGDKNPAFNPVFAKHAYALARECYAACCAEQGRKFEALSRMATKGVVFDGSLSHRILVKCIGLRAKEDLSRFIRSALGVQGVK